MVPWIGITSVIGVTLFVLGCGGSSSSKKSSDSGNSCNIKLTGAVNGSYACYAPPALGAQPSTSGATVEFQATGSNSDGVIATVLVMLPSEATSKTYQSGDANFYGDVDLQSIPGWYRALTGDTSEPDSGSVSFTISSIDAPSEYQGTSVRLVHGSAHANLLPASAQGSGQVTCDATF